MAQILDNPTHWRKRAEEARTLADIINDPEAKRMMLRLVETYEELAIRASQRAWLMGPDDSSAG